MPRRNTKRKSSTPKSSTRKMSNKPKRMPRRTKKGSIRAVCCHSSVSRMPNSQLNIVANSFALQVVTRTRNTLRKRRPNLTARNAKMNHTKAEMQPLVAQQRGLQPTQHMNIMIGTQLVQTSTSHSQLTQAITASELELAPRMLWQVTKRPRLIPVMG